MYYLTIFISGKGRLVIFISSCISLVGKSIPTVFPAFWPVSYLHLMQTGGLLSTNVVVKKKSSVFAGFKDRIINFLKKLKVRKVLFCTRNFSEVLGSLPEQMNKLKSMC